MKTEQILADAEVAAVYLRALLDKVSAAVTLTGNYALAVRCASAALEEPKKPWEPE
jgi:hypothetical protein